MQIFADDDFTAYLNGINIGSGVYYPLSYISITPIAGINNLTVFVNNNAIDYLWVGSSPAILIFSITQDQNIPSCVNNNYYDHSTCVCKCNITLTCTYPQTWLDYPSCKCGCSSLCSGCVITDGC